MNELAEAVEIPTGDPQLLFITQGFCSPAH